MGLLDNRGNPDGVDAKALDVVKLLGDSLEVSAVPGADLVLAVLVAPEGVVVRGIAVVEAIGHDEVDNRIVPVKGTYPVLVSLCLEHQDALGVRSRLHGDLSALHLCLCSGVGVTDDGAVLPGGADINLYRAAVPGLAVNSRQRPLELGLLGRAEDAYRGSLGVLVVEGEGIGACKEDVHLKRCVRAGLERNRLAERELGA